MNSCSLAYVHVDDELSVLLHKPQTNLLNTLKQIEVL